MKSAEELSLEETARRILSNLRVYLLVHKESDTHVARGIREDGTSEDETILHMPSAGIQITRRDASLTISKTGFPTASYAADACLSTNNRCNFFQTINFPRIARRMLGIGVSEPQNCSLYVYGHAPPPHEFQVVGDKSVQPQHMPEKTKSANLDTSIRKLRKGTRFVDQQSQFFSLGHALLQSVLAEVLPNTEWGVHLFAKAFQISDCGSVRNVLRCSTSSPRAKSQGSDACDYHLVDSDKEAHRLLQRAKFNSKPGCRTVLIAALGTFRDSDVPRVSKHICGVRVRLVDIAGCCNGLPRSQGLAAFRDACMQRATLCSPLDLCTSVVGAEESQDESKLMTDDEAHALLSGTETCDPVNETEIVVLCANFPLVAPGSITEPKQIESAQLSLRQAMSTVRFGDILIRARNVTFQRYLSPNPQGDKANRYESPPKNKSTSPSPPQSKNIADAKASSMKERCTNQQAATDGRSHVQHQNGDEFPRKRSPRSSPRPVLCHGATPKPSKSIKRSSRLPRDMRRRELVALQRTIDEMRLELSRAKERSVRSESEAVEPKHKHEAQHSSSHDSVLTAAVIPSKRSKPTVHIPVPLDHPLPPQFRACPNICHCSDAPLTSTNRKCVLQTDAPACLQKQSAVGQTHKPVDPGPAIDRLSPQSSQRAQRKRHSTVPTFRRPPQLICEGAGIAQQCIGHREAERGAVETVGLQSKAAQPGHPLPFCGHVVTPNVKAAVKNEQSLAVSPIATESVPLSPAASLPVCRQEGNDEGAENETPLLVRQRRQNVNEALEQLLQSLSTSRFDSVGDTPAASLNDSKSSRKAGSTPAMGVPLDMSSSREFLTPPSSGSPDASEYLSFMSDTTPFMSPEQGSLPALPLHSPCQSTTLRATPRSDTKQTVTLAKPAVQTAAGDSPTKSTAPTKAAKVLAPTTTPTSWSNDTRQLAVS